MEIEQYLKIIPELLCYYIPGVIFFAVYDWGRFVTAKERAIQPRYIVASFLIHTLVSSMVYGPFWIVTAADMLVSFLLGVLFAKIVRSSWFDSLTQNVFSRTSQKGFWLNVLDMDNGTQIEAYMNDGLVYSGIVDCVEEGAGGDCLWFSLKQCDVYQFDEPDKKSSMVLPDYKSVAVLNMRDVKSMRVIYPNSPISFNDQDVRS